jgi:hypothetical protein
VTTEDVLATLAVERVPLADELRAFAKMNRFKDDVAAIVSFSDGWIQFRIGGEDVSAPATGYWPGEPRLPASLLRSLTKFVVVGDALGTIEFRVQNGRVLIGGHAVPSAPQALGAATIERPTGASLRDVLVRTMYAADLEIEQSGLKAKVSAARERKRNLVVRAAALLAPLSITADQLERFVDGNLR